MSGCTCDAYDGLEHWSSCGIYIQPDYDLTVVPPTRTPPPHEDECPCSR